MASRPSRTARARFLPSLTVLVALAACPAGAAGTISIAWDPVDSAILAGYRVFVGGQSGEYADEFDLPVEQTGTVLVGLASCTEHFVTVRSVGTDGALSHDSSNEISGWPAPRVTEVLPPEARAGRTTVLTLDGVNFRPAAVVEFADPTIRPIATEVVDCRTVQVTVEIDPDAVVGSTSGATLVNPDGTYGEAAAALSILPQFDIETGLVAHWTMDADSIDAGLLLDRSGHGHHGELDEGLATEPGRIGEALRFTNGLDQGIVVGDSDELDLAGPFTIAAWVNADSFGEQQTGAIVSKFNGSRVEGWSLELSNTGADASQRAFGLTYQSVVAGQLDTGELFRWQHLALTHEAGALTFWVDGLPTRTVDVNHAPNPGLRHVTIGNDKLRSADFDGLIDELRLYDRVLEGGAIALLADAEPGDVADTVVPDTTDSGPAEADPPADEPCPDGDGDGLHDATCGGTDCDDGNATVHPGATEVCDDGVDQDCDGLDEACVPAEGDEPGPSAVPQPIARWSMDLDTIDGDLLHDVSGHGHHGEIVGAGSEPGRFGDALRFRNTENDYVVVPDADALDLTGGVFTISAWIRLESFGENRAGAVLSKFFPARVEGWELGLEGAQNLSLRVLGLTYQSDVESAPQLLELRRWHQIAIVHEAGWLGFWVDGVWHGSFATMHEPNAGLRDVYIGNVKSRTADFDGLIDEVAIWDVALDDDAIRALADGPAAGAAAP